MNGRPSHAKLLKLFRLLKAGGRRIRSCDAAGVSYYWFRDELDRNPDFKLQVEEAEVASCEVVEEALFNTAINGNVVAQQVFLYNRAPDRWADKRTVAHSGPGGGPIAFQLLQIAELSDEELDKRLEAATSGGG